MSPITSAQDLCDKTTPQWLKVWFYEVVMTYETNFVVGRRSVVLSIDITLRR